MYRLSNIIFIVIGTISLTLGVIGIFLPLLPTTPFIMLAAACYAKGSKRCYNLLINNKYLGSYIRNYREGRGIPLKAKILSISLLWITIGYSALFVVPVIYVKIFLLLTAIGVTYHILTIKTLEQNYID